MVESYWSDYAMCGGMDPELFFPISDAGVQYAKSICAVCPVREQCLNMALTEGLDDGVFGGHTAEERRKLREHVARKAAVEKTIDRILAS